MTKVTVDTLGIPRNVLFNRVRGFGQVHQTYKVTLYTEYFKKLHQSFADRAFWGTDEYGESWDVLEILTDMIKAEELETGQPYNEDDEYNRHRDGMGQPQFNSTNPKTAFRNKRQLAPSVTPFKGRSGSIGVDAISQVDIYRKKQEQLKMRNNPKSIRQRGREALQGIPKIDGGMRASNFSGQTEYTQRTPINIRSGRLFAAFFPGEVANNRIYGGPDQTFKLEGLNLEFNINRVPYADDCELPTPKGKVRLLITKPLEPGGPAFMDCHRMAIHAARVVYDQLLNNQTKREERTSNDREHPPAPRRRPS